MINVALDVSKGLSHYVVVQDGKATDEGIVHHNKVNFQRFYRIFCCFEETLNVIFESTGVYSKPL